MLFWTTVVDKYVISKKISFHEINTNIFPVIVQVHNAHAHCKRIHDKKQTYLFCSPGVVELSILNIYA